MAILLDVNLTMVLQGNRLAQKHEALVMIKSFHDSARASPGFESAKSTVYQNVPLISYLF